MRELGAAALQHVNRELARVRGKRQPQRRTGGGAAVPGPAPQHAPRAAFARGDLQAPQRARLLHIEPCERGAAIAGAQRLLVSPQRFAYVATAHHDEIREVHAGRGERRRVRPVRRGDPNDRTPLVRHAYERRQRQAQLADALAREQDLREPRSRPAPARQHGVERRMARRQRGRLG